MYTEKILRIVNVKVQECWEMVMYTEKMPGIHNVHRKNARNRYYVQKERLETPIHAKECSESAMCMQKEHQESTKRAENMLGIDNTRKEETQNREKLMDDNDILKDVNEKLRDVNMILKDFDEKLKYVCEILSHFDEKLRDVSEILKTN